MSIPGLQHDQVLFYIVGAGAFLTLLALTWVILRAFRTRIAWGISCLFLLPIPFFIVVHWKRARLPASLLALGLVMAAGPITANRLGLIRMDLGERERIVDGELHLTLTGWDKSDYSFLSQKSDVVVLQMANPDVTDAVLDHLQGHAKLRELDLNESAVTDAGLEKLARLPALTDLRLRKTAITEEGFRASLLGKESLRNLDLRETAVKSATAREWKNAKPDRQLLK